MNFSNPDFVARKVLKPTDEPFVPTMRPPAEQLHKPDEPRNTVPMASPKSAPVSERPLTASQIRPELPALVEANPGMASKQLLEILQRTPPGLSERVRSHSIGNMLAGLARANSVKRVEVNNVSIWYPVDHPAVVKQNPDPDTVEKSGGIPASALATERSSAASHQPAQIAKPQQADGEPDNPAALPLQIVESEPSPAIAADPVNHPPHYCAHPSGVECIDITEHLNFCVGNAIKYLWRAGLKDGTDAITDLQKARWYIEREIARLSK